MQVVFRAKIWCYKKHIYESGSYICFSGILGWKLGGDRIDEGVDWEESTTDYDADETSHDDH